MTRSFRHNLAASAQLAPQQCDMCRELSVQHVLRINATWGGEFTHWVCDECLPERLDALKRSQIAYRLEAI